MTIVFVMKNNAELKVKCEEFSVEKDKFTGQITSYSIKGITENKPLYMPLEEIEMIYRVMSDEEV